MMKKNSYEISTGFCRQFKHLSSALTVAVNRCPDELWIRPRTRTSASPSHIVWHAVESLAMPHILNIPADELPDLVIGQDIPTKSQAIALLSAVAEHVAQTYTKLSDEAILGKQNSDSSPGVRNLMYALRHTQHHIGTFIQILKEENIKAPVWSSANMM
jgi:hypothetical protein